MEKRWQTTKIASADAQRSTKTLCQTVCLQGMCAEEGHNYRQLLMLGNITYSAGEGYASFMDACRIYFL